MPALQLSELDTPALVALLAQQRSLMSQMIAPIENELLSRLVQVNGSAARRAKGDDDADTMLTTEEAAELLRRSPRWIYRNAHRLPFVRRLSARSMLHSKQGIERYLASRTRKA